MATRSNSELSNQTQYGSGRVVAFFSDRNAAYHALSRLKEAGFRNDRIGLAVGSGQKTTQEQEYDSYFWQKVKGFFTGEDHHESCRFNDVSNPMGWTMTATNITSEALPLAAQSSP